jgi:hypothetical protein
MVEQLLQEAEPTLGEKKYLRLIGGKVTYISEAEAMKEEVLAGPRKRLTEEEILVGEWDDRVQWANELKERISLVHQMMGEDDEKPSQYEPVYNTLWDEYKGAIESLREVDSEAVDQFRDKVVGRLKELETRIDDLCRNHDPDYFDYLERTLSLYEKTYDLAVALGWRTPQPQLPEAKHPCYKADLLCRLAENGPLSECIYQPETCPWRQSRRVGESKQEGIQLEVSALLGDGYGYRY